MFDDKEVCGASTTIVESLFCLRPSAQSAADKDRPAAIRDYRRSLRLDVFELIERICGYLAPSKAISL